MEYKGLRQPLAKAACERPCLVRPVLGFRLGSALVKKVDEITQGLLKDGTLKAIAEKYDLADRLISG